MPHLLPPSNPFPSNDMPRFVEGESYETCWSHLASAKEMRNWDALTQKEYALPTSMLMENAAREALDVLVELLGGTQFLRGKRVLLFAGPGNNGGDTIALARNLVDYDCRVALVHTRTIGSLRGAAAEHMRIARKCGVFCLPAKRWLEHAKRHYPWPDVMEPALQANTPNSASLAACTPGFEESSHPDIIIDGLLGSGFTPPLDDVTASLVQAINRLRGLALILSLDAPTGLNEEGSPAPIAVRAHHTVSFQTNKFSLLMPSAIPFVGQVHVHSVGIPAQVQEKYPTRMRLLETGCLSALPILDPSLHKARAGHVLVIGGSSGLTGAPLLAAMGALRGGAGLVTIACPAGLAQEIKAGSPDIMTLPVGTGMEWDARFMPNLIAHARRCDAIVLGPGLGRSASATIMVQGFLQHTQEAGMRAPAVIDADALYALSTGQNPLALPTERDILTPHPLEMARLLEGKPDALADGILADRMGALDTFTAECKAAINLKGACSLITQAGKAVHVSPFIAPCLAVGGSGDVLSGLLAALLAQGVPPLPAACLGVYWHGNAGVMLEEHFPMRGNTAREIADILPQARLYRPE